MTMLLICFIFNIFWKDDKGHVTHDLCHQELIVHFFKDFIYLFLERQERREKEEEKHQCVVASRMPPTWPTTQACALTGNQIGDPLI